MSVQTDPFLEVFPDEPADQLAWYAAEFGISRDQILRLMGLSPADREAVAAESWAAIADRWPNETAYVLGLLGETLEWHYYDWKKVAAEIARPDLPAYIEEAIEGAADRPDRVLRFIYRGASRLTDWVLAFLKLTKAR